MTTGYGSIWPIPKENEKLIGGHESILVGRLEGGSFENKFMYVSVRDMMEVRVMEVRYEWSEGEEGLG